MSDLEMEAYRILARIKYSELYISLNEDTKERIKSWMNKYEEALVLESKQECM